MQTTHKLNETPKERLERVARSSAPFRRELGGPAYLVGITLLLLAILMVAIGILGGTFGSEVMGEYARHIIEWASPVGR